VSGSEFGKATYKKGRNPATSTRTDSPAAFMPNKWMTISVSVRDEEEDAFFRLFHPPPLPSESSAVIYSTSISFSAV
jgi:hypothetical protein